MSQRKKQPTPRKIPSAAEYIAQQLLDPLTVEQVLHVDMNTQLAWCRLGLVTVKIRKKKFYLLDDFMAFVKSFRVDPNEKKPSTKGKKW